MRDSRRISALGFTALLGTFVTMLAISTHLVPLHMGIWLVTMALGVYAAMLGMGHLQDRRLEHQRRRTNPWSATEQRRREP